MVAELEAKLCSAAWSTEFTGVWRQVVGEMRLAGNLLGPEARETWEKIVDHLQAVGDAYEASRAR